MIEEKVRVSVQIENPETREFVSVCCLVVVSEQWAGHFKCMGDNRGGEGDSKVQAITNWIYARLM